MPYRCFRSFKSLWVFLSSVYWPFLLLWPYRYWFSCFLHCLCTIINVVHCLIFAFWITKTHKATSISEAAAWGLSMRILSVQHVLRHFNMAKYIVGVDLHLNKTFFFFFWRTIMSNSFHLLWVYTIKTLHKTPICFLMLKTLYISSEYWLLHL